MKTKEEILKEHLDNSGGLSCIQFINGAKTTYNAVLSAMQSFASQTAEGGEGLKEAIDNCNKLGGMVSEAWGVVVEKEKEISEWKQIAVDALSGEEMKVYNAYVKFILEDSLLSLESLHRVLQLVDGKPGLNTLTEVIERLKKVYKNEPIPVSTITDKNK